MIFSVHVPFFPSLHGHSLAEAQLRDPQRSRKDRPVGAGEASAAEGHHGSHWEGGKVQWHQCQNG